MQLHKAKNIFYNDLPNHFQYAHIVVNSLLGLSFHLDQEGIYIDKHRFKRKV